MSEMFGQKKDFRGLNAFFPKTHSMEAKHTPPKKDTVPKKSTVPKVGTVLSNATLLKKLNSIIKANVQLVYLNLYKLSHNQHKTTTDWLGYKEIALQCNISHNTARRAIHTLTQKGLIERVEVKNEKDVKGSRYCVILPTGKHLSAQKGHRAQIEHRAHKQEPI